MIEVVRFHDVDGIGMFHSEHFETNEFHDVLYGENAYNAKRYPRLTRIIPICEAKTPAFMPGMKRA